MSIVYNRGITRREFIRVSSSALLGLAVSPYAWGHEEGQGSIFEIPPHRVVRVHNVNATFWDFASDYYWNFVRRDAVNAMVERGVRELTDQSTLLGAWQQIMSSYQSGDKVAIKINLNGYRIQTPDNHTEIDALIEVVDSVVGGLVSLGIPQSDISVFDASRIVPTVRYQSCTIYPQVNFLGVNEVTFGEVGDPDEEVGFTCADLSGVTKYIADVVVTSQHLINIPIMKSHATGITGTFKNHFGTVNEPIDVMHCCIGYSENNPLVDIYLNPHIRDKTRLIVGDGLFGMSVGTGMGAGPPHRWTIFDDISPNSLFFSIDPVAIDSVMLDYILAERDAHGLWTPDHNHLHCAHSAGLGIHEHRDELGQFYGIDFVDVEMSTSVEDQTELGAVHGFQLFQNYPNPFNPTTIFEYHLSRPVRVILSIYNVSGQKVITLVDKHQSRGLKRIIWGGTNDSGKTVASGIYFCTLKAGEFTQTKKITLLR